MFKSELAYLQWFYCEEQFFGTLKSPKLKYLEKPFIQKNVRHIILKIISAQISRKNFFFPKKIFFQWFGDFFATIKPLIWASFFSTKKHFFSFFQVWLFNFNIILNICFKILFRKTVKNWWFYFLNKPLEPYKLPWLVTEKAAIIGI